MDIKTSVSGFEFPVCNTNDFQSISITMKILFLERIQPGSDGLTFATTLTVTSVNHFILYMTKYGQPLTLPVPVLLTLSGVEVILEPCYY